MNKPLILPWSIPTLFLVILIHKLIERILGKIVADWLYSLELDWESHEYLLFGKAYLLLGFDLFILLLFKLWCMRGKVKLNVLWGEKCIAIPFALFLIILGVSFQLNWQKFIITTAPLDPIYPTNLMFIGAIASMGLAGPLIEELFYRGILYETMRIYCDAFTAIIFTTVIFTLVHTTLWYSPDLLIFVFIVGIVTAILAEYTDSLTAPYIFHISVNIAGVIDYQFR